MNKAYSNWIPWENKPSTRSPIDEIALNKISEGLDVVDDRVIALDTSKLNTSDAQQDLVDFQLNLTNGVITVRRRNGSTYQYDTLLEKIAVNFDYDDNPSSPHYQNLIITLDDGTVKYVDISTLISQYEFDDSATISFLQDRSHIKAIVKNGSITADKLQPDYLADVTQQATYAHTSADNALTSENNARYEAKLAKSYAIGDEETREGSSTDNAKYYKDLAEQYKNSAKTSEDNARASEDAAKVSEDNASDSEDNALISEQHAEAYKNLAFNYLNEVRQYRDEFIPEFYLDADEGILYMKAVPGGSLDFVVNEEDGCLYWSMI